MYYNLAQLLKEPTGSTRYYEVDGSFIGPENSMDRAQGWVWVIRTHQGVLVRAELETWVKLTCGRCIDQFELQSRLKMEEESFPTDDLVSGQTTDSSEETEGVIHLDAQHVLDMTEVLRQCVLTEVPIKPLCCEECLGLCPGCGSNLNKEKCKCNAALADPRWVSLAEL
ncbi:MAG: DUF177 domain-containing protein [Chloroflexi bacterium]|nr:DUF177 domain-containing protein [Chloroflexota bacterium]MCH8891877.1 DUF177 domain-containing protein [Chloroflexota bacterium]MCI0788240.1 DUF177 domain-containing protein [Chloroflexota bacterium]MCI0800750.1 DUF177 domain-containing protein [Chloroflexota bacterium]MCI0810304.1 DUF177 domain-containing protein [Chloroflexota bacterium]